jgi:hypothetical protein
MTSEPKTEGGKRPFRFPALAPKRRFRANPPATETGHLDEEANRPSHRPKLKRSGRVILRWPSQATHLAHAASALATVTSYTP